ncbi:MAG: endopeptidase La [Salibacteraceae bacterium]|jgi:ATP-dependent Lon protease|nr:endopeptidase La [Salibacteraceae bacterium]MDP4687780.1 endopeptidase La [Salibacteraceae bacterium]MDP4965556.1 endopeptidase La [Salibacteraceae bacterium]
MIDDNLDFSLMQLSGMGDEATEFIPLMSSEDEKKMYKEETPEKLPILPVRNTVLFPGVVIPITVGRDKSLKLIKDAYKGNKIIGVVAQKDQSIEEPLPEHLFEVGTVAKILKMLKMPDGSSTIIIQGIRRIKVKEVVETEPYFTATVEVFEKEEVRPTEKRFKALVSTIKDMALRIIHESPNIPSEASIAIKNIESSGFLINFISANMQSPVNDKQALLEISDWDERANKLLEHLNRDLQMLEIKNDIQSKVRFDIDKQQREYFLSQQMKTIQEELGGNPMEQELKELRQKGLKKKWNENIKKVFQKELSKLERMNPNGMEYSVQSNYLEVFVELPWGEFSKDKFDLKKAEKILDRDHYGLTKIKERIIEHLAVLKLKGDMKSPILCFNGPPGVGKTSLGKSIAEALGRKYVRMSLGGLRDEAEIRGHRKTYIGAMPGRIIQNLKKVGTSNPVFILDELDKVGATGHGDPSSALLEVLDPEQNSTFYDNFLEEDFDLSNVLFIATTNNLGAVHPALRDRLEVIEVSGYTLDEKVNIATKHLIPKQLKEHGLVKTDVKFPKKAIENVVEGYTRESGVRQLEKQLAGVIRKKAKQLAMEEEGYVAAIDPNELQDMLGPGHYRNHDNQHEVPGVANGLAWTSVGGEVLYIETSITKGKGKLTLTGNLGDVMKESAVIAMEYLKSHANTIGFDEEVFNNYNFHIHVPEGATPKDGPSAGITIFTALASILTQRKFKSTVAMTGEITLRGKVLPVGGIKEKILAAKRAGMKDIILSVQNEKDINEIEPHYLTGLKFHFVERMIEIPELALEKQKVKNALTIA